MKEKILRNISCIWLPAIMAMCLQANATESYFGLAIFNPEDIYDETFIAFDHNAMDSVDQFDAPKLTGLSDIYVYTKIGPGDYSVQVLSQLTEDKIITVGIDADMSGMHMLRLMHVEDLDASVAIILEDTHTGTFVNMRKNNDYWFNLSPGTGMERFRLHVNPAIGITTVDGTCDGTESRLEIRQEGSFAWNYEIKDGNDSIIDAGTSWNGTRTLTELPTGTYKIALEDQYGYAVEKIASVVDKEAVTAQFQISDSVTMTNQPVHFFDYSAGASDYIWDFGDGNTISGEPYPTYGFEHPGTYEITFTASNDECSDVTSKTIEVVGQATGLNDARDNAPVIYFYGRNVFIDVPASPDISHVNVYNAAGQRIFSGKLNSAGKQSIELSERCNFCIAEIQQGNKKFIEGGVAITH
jgi:hypothetical protein